MRGPPTKAPLRPRAPPPPEPSRRWRWAVGVGVGVLRARRVVLRGSPASAQTDLLRPNADGLGGKRGGICMYAPTSRGCLVYLPNRLPPPHPDEAACTDYLIGTAARAHARAHRRRGRRKAPACPFRARARSIRPTCCGPTDAPHLSAPLTLGGEAWSAFMGVWAERMRCTNPRRRSRCGLTGMGRLGRSPRPCRARHWPSGESPSFYPLFPPPAPPAEPGEGRRDGREKKSLPRTEQYVHGSPRAHPQLESIGYKAPPAHD